MRLLQLMMPIALGAALVACATPAATGTPPSAMLDQARSRVLYLDVIRKLNSDGKGHAALAYLDDYDRRFPDDQSARLLRADCLLGAGALKQAEEIYLTLAQGADSAAAQAGLGKIAAARGDWTGAVHAYERAVAAEPLQFAYRNDLGYALLQTGAVDRAAFVLRQAAELAPGNAHIRRNLALALSRRERP